VAQMMGKKLTCGPDTNLGWTPLPYISNVTYYQYFEYFLSGFEKKPKILLVFEMIWRAVLLIFGCLKFDQQILFFGQK
jgi:hypothetical protein